MKAGHHAGLLGCDGRSHYVRAVGILQGQLADIALLTGHVLLPGRLRDARSLRINVLARTIGSLTKPDLYLTAASQRRQMAAVTAGAQVPTMRISVPAPA